MAKLLLVHAARLHSMETITFFHWIFSIVISRGIKSSKLYFLATILFWYCHSILFYGVILWFIGFCDYIWIKLCALWIKLFSLKNWKKTSKFSTHSKLSLSLFLSLSLLSYKEKVVLLQQKGQQRFMLWNFFSSLRNELEANTKGMVVGTKITAMNFIISFQFFSGDLSSIPLCNAKDQGFNFDSLIWGICFTRHETINWFYFLRFVLNFKKIIFDWSPF